MAYMWKFYEVFTFPGDHGDKRNLYLQDVSRCVVTFMFLVTSRFCKCNDWCIGRLGPGENLFGYGPWALMVFQGSR